MKAYTLLLSAGLASARVNLPRQAGFNNVSSNAPSIGVNSPSSFSVGDFNLGDLNLGGLEVGGVNLGNVDLGNQDVIVEAILAMLGGFCLGGALDQNNILSFGFNNDVEMFFQLAELMQLEQLGFLDLGGIQSLFSNGNALGGFNLGVLKREISEARKTMKRTKLRRGQKVKRQCAPGGVGSVNSGNSGAGVQGDGIVNIATAPPNAFTTVTVTEEEAGFTIGTAPVVEAGAAITTAETSVSVAPVSTSTSVAQAVTSTFVASIAVTSIESVASSSVALVAAAASQVTSITAVDQIVATSSTAPVAAAASAPVQVDSVASASAPVAAATSAAADVAGGVENLSDLTR